MTVLPQQRQTRFFKECSVPRGGGLDFLSSAASSARNICNIASVMEVKYSCEQ